MIGPDSYGVFALVAEDVAPGTARPVIEFDLVKTESWSLPQEVPEYAVAQQKLTAQIITGNPTFRASLVVTETPLPRLRGITLASDGAVTPGDLTGPDRVMAVWRALQENAARRWKVYTVRHGILRSMVLTNIDEAIDGPVRRSTFDLSFQTFVQSDILSIKVQASPRAKKAAVRADDRDFGESLYDERDLMPSEDTSIAWEETFGSGTP